MLAPEPDLRQCFGFRTRRAMRALAHHYDRHLAPSGLRGTQFSILAALRSQEARSLPALANQLGLERTSLLRALRTLAAAGLLDAQHRLTPLGESRFQDALPRWQAAQAMVARELGPDAAAITALESLGARLGRPTRAAARAKDDAWTAESGC